MTTAASNKLKYMLSLGLVDFANDTFKIALMANTFVWDKDTAHDWANISANELANGTGYTAGGATLANVAVTEDDTDDRTEVTWNNVSWTAANGNIGPTPGAIIYCSNSTPANGIVGYIDFAGNQTQANDGVFTIADIEVRIA